MSQHTTIEITGPYDLGDVALMSFGYRDEDTFDGAMRMAFCLDGGYERAVGVVARQVGDRLELDVEAEGGPLDEAGLAAVQAGRPGGVR